MNATKALFLLLASVLAGFLQTAPIDPPSSGPYQDLDRSTTNTADVPANVTELAVGARPDVQPTAGTIRGAAARPQAGLAQQAQQGQQAQQQAGGSAPASTQALALPPGAPPEASAPLLAAAAAAADDAHALALKPAGGPAH